VTALEIFWWPDIQQDQIIDDLHGTDQVLQDCSPNRQDFDALRICPR
jgi:hypothetical protein